MSGRAIGAPPSACAQCGTRAARYSYDDPCGVARALDAVGERWALLVVRELLLGPKRFTDLATGLPGVSQNVLSQRLRELEESGVVHRHRLGPPAGARVYELTDRGVALEPVVLALGRWGSRAPLTSTAPLGVDALVVALRTMFDPTIADDLQASYALDLRTDRFHAEIDPGRFRIARGDPPDPDARLGADAGTLRALVFGGGDIDEAMDRGDLVLAGDRAAAQRFLRCFPRPVSATR